MTVKELLDALKGVDLNARVLVWADHHGHWDTWQAGTAYAQTNDEEYEQELWHPDDLKEFQKECAEDGEKYEPEQVFVISGIG